MRRQVLENVWWLFQGGNFVDSMFSPGLRAHSADSLQAPVMPGVPRHSHGSPPGTCSTTRKATSIL